MATESNATWKVWTFNGSCWNTCKKLVQSTLVADSQVLLFQEIRLQSDEEIRFASDFLGAHGWLGQFAPAATTQEGGLTGGVCIAYRDGLNIGTVEVSTQPDPSFAHRVLAVRLHKENFLPHVLVSAYFKVGEAMRGVNLELLKYIAMLAETERLPLMVGGDFNCSPGTIQASDYFTRSGTIPLTPGEPTCFHKQSQSMIDYFLCTQSLASLVHKVKTATQWPSGPHRPVCLSAECSDSELVPTLLRPKQIPVEVPVGPSRLPSSWDSARATVEGLEELLEERTLSWHQEQEAIDGAFEVVNALLARTLCEVTDTPYDPRCARGAPLRIQLMPISARAARERKSWVSLSLPLAWIKNQLQSLQYVLSQEGLSLSGSLQQLAADVSAPPVDLFSLDGVKNAYAQLQELVQEAVLLSDRSDVAEGDQEVFAQLLSRTDALQTDVSKLLISEQASDARTSDQNWRSWIREVNDGSLGWAHRWSRASPHWRPFQHHREGWTGRPTCMLASEVQRLSKLWEAQPTPLDPWIPDSDLPAPPPLEPDRFLQVSASFRSNTAQTFDGYHPKHYSLLSPDQALVLCKLLQCCERHGSLPSNLLSCLAALIPKHKSDGTGKTAMRSIGLLPSLYRVWAKCRQDQARSWEQSHPCVSIAHQKGRSIADQVFIQSAQAEHDTLVTGRPKLTTAIFYDLANFYEYIDRSVLLARARQWDFPVLLLYLVLNQYQSRRAVSLNGYVGDAGYPARGIPAGCPWATYLVQIYSLHCVIGLQQRWIPHTISMYIDDLVLLLTGATLSELVNTAAQAAADALSCIDQELHCAVALHKATVVGSSESVRSAVVQALGKYAGPASTGGASHLGIDFFGGQLRRFKRNRRTLLKRIASFKKRMPRLRTLKKGGLNLQRLWNTGLQQAQFHGADVVGMDQRELTAAQTNMLSLVGVKCRSRSRTASLMLYRDPCYSLGLGPVLTWGGLVFKANTRRDFYQLPSLPKLQSLFSPVLANPPSNWSQVRGPMGAVLMSLDRIQWRPSDTPLVLVDHHGKPVNLAITSSASLRFQLQQAWQYRLGCHAAERLGCAGDHFNLDTAQQVLLEPDLSPSEKGVLRAFLTSAIWTPSRLSRAGYELPSEACVLCGAPRDDLHHRLFTCPGTACLRTEHLSEAALDYLANVQKSFPIHLGMQRTVRFDRGAPPGLGHLGGIFWSQDPTLSPEQAFAGQTLCTDGACFKNGPKACHVAGWAVCAVNSLGECTASLYGPVGQDVPHTSPVSEHLAFLALGHACPNPAEICVDYQGLVNINEMAPKDLYDKSSVHAGLRLQIVGSPLWSKSTIVSKVTAHQDPACFEVGSRERQLALGNQRADNLAKAGALLLHQPSSAELEEWAFDSQTLRRFLRYVAKALILWPAPGSGGPRSKRSKNKYVLARDKDPELKQGCLSGLEVLGPWRLAGGGEEPRLQAGEQSEYSPPQPLALDASASPSDPVQPPEPLFASIADHSFVWVENRFVCKFCLRQVKRLPKPHAVSSCPGTCKVLHDLYQDSRQHQLYASTFTDPSRFGIVICCKRCGSTSEGSRVKGLGDTCPKVFSSPHAAGNWKRLSEGKHPNRRHGSGKVMDPCVALSTFT